MYFLNSRRTLTLLLVLVFLILAPVFLYDRVFADDICPGGPGPPTAVVMIDAATLNSWINNGYNNGVTDPFGYTDMVVIAVQVQANYEAGHPTGAYLWAQNELRTLRSDGILSITSNVATRPMMDVIIQRAGINDDTVVVITGNHMMQIGLAYFNFRYWGFPKERLKVMNGLIVDYISDGYTTATGVSADAGGGNTVCTIASQSTSVDEVRASLAEMMSVAADGDPTTIPLDVRSSAEYNGTNAGAGGRAFTGRIRTAEWNEWVDQTTTGSATASGSQIKDAASLTTIFNAIGITSADTSYIY